MGFVEATLKVIRRILFLGFLVGLNIWILPAQAEPGWSLQAYIKAYMAEDERLTRAKLEQDFRKQSLVIASDTFQGNFQLKPGQTHKTQSFLGQGISGFDFYERRGVLTGTYEQLLPLGTTLRLEGSRYFEKSNPSIGSLDSEYAFTLSQPLWRNNFGSLFRLQQSQAEQELDAAKLAVSLEALRSCQQGIETYLKTFFYKQNQDIHQEILKASQQATDLTRQARQRRLLREIDWLAAQADHLRVQSSVIEARNEYRAQVVQFLVSVGDERAEASADVALSGVELQDPASFFRAIPLSTDLDLMKNLAYLQKLNEFEAASRAVAFKKEDIQSKASFDVSVGQREGLLESGAQLLDFTEEYLLFSLTFDWPVFNQAREAEVAQAVVRRGQADALSERVAQEQMELFGQIKVQLSAVDEQIKLSLKRVGLYEKQVAEALRLLRAGKLQFDDYSRYRDLHLNERTREIELQRSLWWLKTQLASFHQEFLEFCPEGQ